MNQVSIRPRTVTLIGKLLRPLTDEGLISIPELREILANLKYLVNRGELLPVITPKLIKQDETAEMICIGLSNFKKLEQEGAFSFKRRMIGSGIRYRNTDVLRYILAEGNNPAQEGPSFEQV